VKYFLQTEDGEITGSGSDEESDDEDRVGGHILEKLGIVNIILSFIALVTSLCE